MIIKIRSSVNGCIGRICPCDMWVQCHNYVDIRIKKWKSDHIRDEFLETIHEWYDVHFRRKEEMIDTIPNG